MVIGLKFLFASLNQMKEKAQKIIESTTAAYVFTLRFNSEFINLLGRCEINLKSDIYD